jgi:diguanylate cyclase (GGDEF)-like protein
LHDEVIGTVCSFRDITERKKYEEKLHFQAMHDDLTGLPNRSLLVERLQNAISDANLEDFHVNILIVDLDNFKQVNKSLGHDMGDTLLKLAGQRLVSATNKDDTVARLDGDRFVVISSQNKNEDFHPLVNKSLQTFLQPFDIGNIEINETESVFKNYEFIFTVSIGVSIYPNNGTDCDTLLKNAEAALYRAKELGGNTFQLYQPEFNKNALKHAELVSAIHTALEKEQFIIYYQPVIDLKTNSIVAVEALLRWQHPTLGIIYPKEFIPMTEILGLIVPLGEWVLRNACLQARIWQKAGFPDLHLCVNISGVQLLHNDFIALVRETLSQCEFAANNLEFDLNENALNKDIALLNVKINEFKAMGIGINIDDFGSDPQNMHFFKEVAFNKLKIINRLINQIAAAEDKSMVSVIIQMAKRMNMKVVAEGVETLAQANYLSTHECDEALGYYYSPPLDHAMFTQLLQKSNGIFKQVINKQ